MKSEFLREDLAEELYMEVPPRHEFSNSMSKVCKLKKALYGLKQSPRAWLGHFFPSYAEIHHKQSQANHMLFMKHSSQGKAIALKKIVCR
jgi:hypothetical protein